ncbi:MAG: hypothetical protein NVSMB62_09880 [Acidobacteriaceae bacterium]
MWGVMRLAAGRAVRAALAACICVCTVLIAQPPTSAARTAAQNQTVRGTIQASGTPLPGVAVTATDRSGTRYATTTDIDGVFQMAVPSDQQYVITAELAGFAPAKQEINAGSSTVTLIADFRMDLASRVPPEQPGTIAATNTQMSPPAGAAAPLVGSKSGDRAAATAQRPAAGPAAARGAVAHVGRGTQVLTMQENQQTGALDASLGSGNTGVSLPSIGGGGEEASSSLATETVAVSGVAGQTNGLAGFSEENIRQRIQDMQRQGGSNGEVASMLLGAMAGGGLGGPGGAPGGRGGPGGGGPGGVGPGGFGGGGGGFGRGFRGQNGTAWHGAFAYNGSDSALNAIPFSVTGRPVSKPPSSTNTLTGSVTGSPYLPGLTKPSPKQFVFLSVQETRNTIPSIAQAIVPTAAQRLGDLTGQGAVYDPNTGKQYTATNCSPALLAINASPSACIPQSELNPSAQTLLSYYPLPNITPLGTQDNFQTITTAENHSSQISARYNRSFGQMPQRGGRGGFPGVSGQSRSGPPVLRQSIAENFSYSHNASSSQSYSPLLGGKAGSKGYSLLSSYTIGYGRLNNTATAGWNRSRSSGTNYFTNGPINPAVAAGVDVANPAIYSNPFYFGVPSIGLTSFSGLNDATPTDSLNQTITVSDIASWRYKRHTMRYGLDYHRIHEDSIGGTNVLGSFTFSGFATENPAAQACPGCAGLASSGSSIADLLIGQPQQTAITAGLNKVYLRANSWDWYAQDDWRARASLTLMFGLRWEYFSPYSEKYGRLVNLNLNGSGPGIQIANVCATAATGCQQVGSGTLVHPDKAMYSPRIGIAWQPKFRFTKNTVVRAGYGLNYNTGQYAAFARKLAFQQPFAITQTNTLASGSNPNTGCTLASLTLTHGFNCSTQLVQSNYGVNPFYRDGFVQVYNLGIQRTLPYGIVFNLDYNGAYAGNLDVLRAPNRTPTGVANQQVTQFTYEDSLGYQRSNALVVNLRQRMRKGISLQATYTYSHSIDDASSVGGSGNFIAQNDQNLGAEESNSSFDRRHQLSGNFVMELPFGPNRAFLNKGGVWSKIMDGYSLSGNYTFASGGWATPVFSGTTTEIAAGAGSSLRPDRVPGQPIAGAGTLTNWFNRAAFIAPAAGAYGNAARNSIELPGTVSVNGVLSRTIPLGETRSIEARIQANNVFNTVQYSGINTVINAPNFSQVSSVAGMRAFTYTARFRF